MFGFLRSIGLKYNAAEIFLPHQIISPLDVHKYISSLDIDHRRIGIWYPQCWTCLVWIKLFILWLHLVLYTSFFTLLRAMKGITELPRVCIKLNHKSTGMQDTVVKLIRTSHKFFFSLKVWINKEDILI